MVAVTYGVIVGERGDAARWRNERRWFRRGPGTPYRKVQTLKHLITRDRAAVRRFLTRDLPFSHTERLRLLKAVLRCTNAVRGYHTLSELLEVGGHILSLSGRPSLTVVEAGAGPGASTAKLSLFTHLAGGHLHVFDTFRGIPENAEQHHLADGTPIRFLKGAFRGRLGAVKKRVQRYGSLRSCTFHKGLFADTLPHFQGHVDVALLDVDLLSSTRECIAELFPRLRIGGCLFSQDGHLRLTHTLLADERFWREEVGRPRPKVSGGKLLHMRA